MWPSDEVSATELHLLEWAHIERCIDATEPSNVDYSRIWPLFTLYVFASLRLSARKGNRNITEFLYGDQIFKKNFINFKLNIFFPDKFVKLT